MQTETVAAGPSGEGKASDGARPALGGARGKGANVNCEICQKLSDSLVSMKEYYSISEAARVLHVHCQRIRELTARREDPLPFRRFPGQQRGGFIHREDLRAWLERNTEQLSGRR